MAEESTQNFSDKSIGGLLKKGTRILMDACIENYQAEARHMMCYILDEDLASIYARLFDEIDDVSAMRYMKCIKKRATHYPLQYIVGFTYFMDYEFMCRENVLIPRYDTEVLVLEAMELSLDRNMKVLDMCTGSGCIGISYKLMREADGYKDKVTLADISDDALSLAKDNADKLWANVEIVKSDMFSFFRDENGKPLRKFDMILCNPPYIKSSDINNLMKDVRDYEPRLALDGAADGLAYYRIVIDSAKEFLRPGGSVVFEIGYDQYMDVLDMMRNEGFEHIRRQKDMSGMDRVISGTL